jgi:hypothetical protein
VARGQRIAANLVDVVTAQRLLAHNLTDTVEGVGVGGCFRVAGSAPIARARWRSGTIPRRRGQWGLVFRSGGAPDSSGGTGARWNLATSLTVVTGKSMLPAQCSDCRFASSLNNEHRRHERLTRVLRPFGAPFPRAEGRRLDYFLTFLRSAFRPPALPGAVRRRRPCSKSIRS